MARPRTRTIRPSPVVAANLVNLFTPKKALEQLGLPMEYYGIVRRFMAGGMMTPEEHDLIRDRYQQWAEKNLRDQGDIMIVPLEPMS